MYVVVALTKCASYEKRDRFRELLAPIARTTIANEHECLTYAWFVSDSENEVPDRYMRGIEAYKHGDALAITHRGSEEYKRMRSAMIPESITEEPTDLRPLKPTGIGFLTRDRVTCDFLSEPKATSAETLTSGGQLLVVRRYMPKTGADHVLRQALEGIVQGIQGPESVGRGTQSPLNAHSANKVLTFWVLNYDKEINDNTVVNIERYADRGTYEDVTRALQPLFAEAASHCDNVQNTRWRSCGLGFIRGLEE